MGRKSTPTRTSEARRGRSDSRKRVLEAAGRLFSRKGYAGTSVDEIASSAKASPSSIYWHFKGGKDGILLAVLEEATSTYVEQTIESVRSGTSLQEKADIFLRSTEHQLQTRQETLRLIMQIALERGREDEAVRQRIRRIYRKFRHAIVHEVKAEFPHLDDGSVRNFATLQIAMFEGVYLQWQLDPEEVNIDEIFTLLRAATRRRIKAFAPDLAEKD